MNPRVVAGRALVLGEDATAAHHVRALRRAGFVAEVAADDLARDALQAWLEGDAPGPIVPHPRMPHLLRDWLATATGRHRAPSPRRWGLPFEVEGPDGTLYLSAAAWRCPATCVEPAHCPVLHAPRDWSLARIIEERAVGLGLLPAVLPVLPLAGGIAAVAALDLLAARGRLAADTSRPALVATSSHCHAAVGVLRHGEPVNSSAGPGA